MVGPYLGPNARRASFQLLTTLVPLAAGVRAVRRQATSIVAGTATFRHSRSASIAAAPAAAVSRMVRFRDVTIP